MRTHTNSFKSNIKEMGKQITTKITYTINNVETELGDEELNSVEPIVQGDILKSSMKELYIDSNVDIPINTIINFQFGVYDWNEQDYEYIDFGNYYVVSSELQEDTKSYYITCYDKMILAMKDYTSVEMIYPTTIREYMTELCDTIGITFANQSDTFANYDKEIQTDLYKDIGYTFRDVLDELAQVTASIICINNDDELEIRYIQDTNDTINEEFLDDNDVVFKKKYGKINSIVLSRSGEADNVYLRDEESVLEDGLCEIKIIDNQIMNFNDRSDYLQDILDTLDGLEFYEMEVSSKGICYYEIGDRYTIQIGNNSYVCVLLNDEINIQQGLEERIYVEEPETSETDYTKADKTDRKINKAFIIVDKQEQTITSMVSKVDTIEKNENNNYQELLGKFGDYALESDVATIENSVTQLQTDTYTKTEINTKLTDGSVTKVQTISGTFDENGMHYAKANAKTSSTINNVGVGVYSTSNNSELLFAGFDENINQSIVRTENLTVRKYLVIGNNSRIEDYEDGGGIFPL